jgi:hypothetical protein
MTDRHAIKTALLNAPQLAKLAGVSVETIRALLKPSYAHSARRKLRPETRRKLAAALRQHSATLATLADSLENPS